MSRAIMAPEAQELEADDGPSWQTHLPPHIEASLLRFYSGDELAAICRALARPPLITRSRLPRSHGRRDLHGSPSLPERLRGVVDGHKD